jgi:hypothetical protein
MFEPVSGATINRVAYKPGLSQNTGFWESLYRLKNVKNA